MKNYSIKLNRSEKIILFLYELSDGEKKKFSYENIVVGLFKKYPPDFHLKGYPEYPDIADSIARLLYGFKKQGFITVENKIFSLTESGIEFGKMLSKKKLNKEDLSYIRFPRSVSVEIDRIKKLEGFVLFSNGEIDQLAESDFYNYLGVSVKTSASTFSGRMKNVETAIDEMRLVKDDPLFSKIVQYHEYLISKYKEILDYFIEK